MCVLWKELKHLHSTTTLCVWGADQKRRRMVEEEARADAETAFQEYIWPLETVTSLKYLG